MIKRKLLLFITAISFCSFGQFTTLVEDDFSDDTKFVDITKTFK